MANSRITVFIGKIVDAAEQVESVANGLGEFLHPRWSRRVIPVGCRRPLTAMESERQD